MSRNSKKMSENLKMEIYFKSSKEKEIKILKENFKIIHPHTSIQHCPQC